MQLNFASSFQTFIGMHKKQSKVQHREETNLFSYQSEQRGRPYGFLQLEWEGTGLLLSSNFFSPASLTPTFFLLALVAASFFPWLVMVELTQNAHHKLPPYLIQMCVSVNLWIRITQEQITKKFRPAGNLQICTSDLVSSRIIHIVQLTLGLSHDRATFWVMWTKLWAKTQLKNLL